MTFSGLIRVDSLVITFLVDNTVEWFGKLPPGMTSEVRNQLANNPPIDPLTNVPFVDLENYCCGAHGFSALIQTSVKGEEHVTLFDAGPESKSIIRNIAAMKEDHNIRKLKRIVLSHWHADHSGGILSVLRHRETLDPDNPVVVDLHPDRPLARGIAPPPTFDRVIGQIPADPTFEEITQYRGLVEKHDEAHAVAGGTVFVSGAIPRITPWESAGLLGSVRWCNDNGKGEWKPDPQIMDERYAVVDVIGKGLVIFTACSHAGVTNVVRDAIKQFQRPIHMILGGLHLGGPELYERIAPTVEFLSRRIRPAPTYILPMHCSGFPAKAALEKEFGEGCVVASVGMRYEVHGDEGFEERLNVSVS